MNAEAELARRIAIGDAVLAWDNIHPPATPLDIAATIIPHLQAIGQHAADTAGEQT